MRCILLILYLGLHVTAVTIPEPRPYFVAAAPALDGPERIIWLPFDAPARQSPQSPRSFAAAGAPTFE